MINSISKSDSLGLCNQCNAMTIQPNWGAEREVREIRGALSEFPSWVVLIGCQGKATQLLITLQDCLLIMICVDVSIVRLSLREQLEFCPTVSSELVCCLEKEEEEEE